jgi:hypothetical protein
LQAVDGGGVEAAAEIARELFDAVRRASLGQFVGEASAVEVGEFYRSFRPWLAGGGVLMR